MTRIITFRHTPTPGPDNELVPMKPDMQVEVVDLYPDLGETYLDGRYVVMVSVEAFIEMIAREGFHPVVPDEPTKKTLDLL